MASRKHLEVACAARRFQLIALEIERAVHKVHVSEFADRRMACECSPILVFLAMHQTHRAPLAEESLKMRPHMPDVLVVAVTGLLSHTFLEFTDGVTTRGQGDVPPQPLECTPKSRPL